MGGYYLNVYAPLQNVKAYSAQGILIFTLLIFLKYLIYQSLHCTDCNLLIDNVDQMPFWSQIALNYLFVLKVAIQDLLWINDEINPGTIYSLTFIR